MEQGLVQKKPRTGVKLALALVSVLPFFYFSLAAYSFYQDASRPYLRFNPSKILIAKNKSVKFRFKETSEELKEIAAHVVFPGIKKLKIEERIYDVSLYSDNILYTQSSLSSDRAPIYQSYLLLKKNFFEATGDFVEAQKIAKKIIKTPRIVKVEPLLSVKNEIKITTQKSVQKPYEPKFYFVNESKKAEIFEGSEPAVVEGNGLFDFVKAEEEKRAEQSYEEWAGYDQFNFGHKATYTKNSEYSDSKALNTQEREKENSLFQSLTGGLTVSTQGKTDSNFKKTIEYKSTVPLNTPAPAIVPSPGNSQVPVSVTKVDPPQGENIFSSLSDSEQDENRETDFSDTYFSAFTNTDSIKAIQSSILSFEGYAGESVRQWKKVSSSGFLDTIYLDSTQQKEEIFLMSELNYNVLSKITSSKKTYNNVGFIFGVLRAGWRLTPEGRTDEVLYFNEKLEQVFSDDLSRAKYFTLFNATPGSIFIKMKHTQFEDEASIFVPVLENKATFINLESFTKRKLALNVRLDLLDYAREVENAYVRILGSKSRIGITDWKGYVEFKDYLSVGKYPVVFDVDTKGGYTHRFTVYPETGKSIDLLVHESKQIESYVYQHGSDVGENGILVSYHDRINEQEYYFPRVVPLFEKAVYEPKSYILSHLGYLLAEQPIDPVDKKTVSLPLPEGFNRLEIKGDSGKTVWSQLFMCSPHVVNILMD